MNTVRKACVAVSFAAAVVGYSLPSSAQQAGLVNVDLRNARILNNIANHLNVNVSNIPITVQVPIDVAANVCAVSVDILSQSAANRGANCYAQTTSHALVQQVQKVMSLQGQ
jgi:hypothetical protein